MHQLRARAATPADHRDFVRFFGELGVDDPVPSEAAWATSMAPNAIFLEREGRPVAYGLAVPYGTVAHVMHVVVAPEARGEGIGRELLLTLGERLRSLGCTSWRLNVKAGNEPAVRLYAKMGFDAAHRSEVLRFPWSAIARLQRADRRLEVVAPQPSEDEGLERIHDLVPGVLGRYRAQTDALLLRLADPDAPCELGLGLARFVPSFPGVMPFRVAEPGFAAALLDACRGAAPPAATHVQIVTEGDDRLTAVLLAAGAVRKYSLLHMRGAIPA